MARRRRTGEYYRRSIRVGQVLQDPLNPWRKGEPDMRNLLRRIPKPFLGFIALFLLIGATACEELLQQGAREAVAAGREIRDLEDTQIRPLEDRMQVLQFDEIEPRQREIEDLYHEIERIQRQVIEPLWNQVNDPWASGGELYEAQEALQEQYALIDAEYRSIELEFRELERRFRDGESNFGGFDPLVRLKEDERYNLQRELDRLYRFGQDPIDEVWKQVNSIHSNPDGTYDSTQLEIEQINNKIAGLYDQAVWLQSDFDNRVREKEDLVNNVRAELNNLYSFGRFPIDEVYAQIAQLETQLNNTTVVTVFEGSDSSAEIEALRAERDALLDDLDIGLAQIDSDIASAGAVRDSTVAFYRDTIDAKNLEISLLATPSDTSASSTPETTGNDEQIEALQAEIAQVEADRDAALALLDGELAGLQSDRTALFDARQPEIDALNVRIFELESNQAEPVTITVIPDGLLEELDAFRVKVALLEGAYTDEVNKLEGLLASVERELNDLYTFGNAPVEQIYRDIDLLNGQLNELFTASEQDQVSLNDAVNALVAQAERLQEELNDQARLLEQLLFNIDDQLQVLYRNGQDDRYDDQIAFNVAQRALEDRRYELDDRRWLLDQQQQDLYSQNNDPYRDVQEKADLIYKTEVQPLQDRINQLEGEMRTFWDEQQSLERQMRLARQSIRDRERELEDQVFDLLEAITADPAADVAGTEELIDGIAPPEGSIAPPEGSIAPPETFDEPVLDPEPVVEPTVDATGADGTVVETTGADAPVDGEEILEPVVVPVQ